MLSNPEHVGPCVTTHRVSCKLTKVWKPVQFEQVRSCLNIKPLIFDLLCFGPAIYHRFFFSWLSFWIDHRHESWEFFVNVQKARQIWYRILTGILHKQWHRGWWTLVLIRFADMPLFAYASKSFFGTEPWACKDCSRWCDKSTEPIPPSASSPESVVDPDMLVQLSELEFVVLGLRKKSCWWNLRADWIKHTLTEHVAVRLQYHWYLCYCFG